MDTQYKVPLPPGVQHVRGARYRSCITVNHRSVFIRYHFDIPSAVAARNRAIEIRDRHIREDLPLTVADLREVPAGSIISPLGQLADLLSVHPDAEREKRQKRNHDRMLMRRWRDWAPAHLELAKAVVTAAEASIAEPDIMAPPGKCPACGHGIRTRDQVLEAYRDDPEVAVPTLEQLGTVVAAYPAGEDGQPLPWEKWIEEFEDELKSRGVTIQHVQNTLHQVTTIIGHCGPGPLCRQSITLSLGALVAKGRSLRTANAHLISTRSFLRFLCDNRRLPFNEARGIRRFKAAKDRRHRRAAFTAEELAFLIRTAQASPVPWGDARIAGVDRARPLLWGRGDGSAGWNAPRRQDQPIPFGRAGPQCLCAGFSLPVEGRGGSDDTHLARRGVVLEGLFQRQRAIGARLHLPRYPWNRSDAAVGLEAGGY